MNSLSNQVGDIVNTISTMRKETFALIVVFDFYDGPERGLAIYPSGEGVRFNTLGDSRSRLFRSYELTTIEGNWLVRALALPGAVTSGQPGQMLIPSEASEMLTWLENDVFDASPTGYYVGVGSPYLEWLSVSPVLQDQLTMLQQLCCSSTGFRAVHQIVKKKRQNKVQ